MKWNILLYIAIANYADVFGKRSRSVGVNNFIASKERKLWVDHNKNWRIPVNPKRTHINMIARQMHHPKKAANLPTSPKHSEKKIYRTKYRAMNIKKILKQVLDEYKTRPVEVRNLPHIKYIARNGLVKKSNSLTPNSASDPRNQSGEIYGNLDNLGITYGKTNQRVVYSWNRKNNPKFRLNKIKQRFSSGGRKTNPKESPTDLDDLPPASSFGSKEKRPKLSQSDSEFGDLSTDENKVNRQVEPSVDTPRSVAVYPQVYGNLDNLGITYGKTNQRVLYSTSRRNALLENLLRLLTRASSYSRQRRLKHPLIVAIYPFENKPVINSNYANGQQFQRDASSGELNDPPMSLNARRASVNNTNSDSDSTDTGSSEYEFNPNNPYTVHKNRYFQNYLWNHEMTGDHMNLNPYAPRIIGIGGATGPELLLSRKWWYFNQDDYIPFG